MFTSGLKIETFSFSDGFGPLPNMKEDELLAYHNHCADVFEDSKDQFESHFKSSIAGKNYRGFSLKGWERALDKNIGQYGASCAGIGDFHRTRFVAPMHELTTDVRQFVQFAKKSSFGYYQRDTDPKSGMIRVYLIINDCLVEVQFLTPFCEHSFTCNSAKHLDPELRVPFDKINGCNPHEVGHQLDVDHYNAMDEEICSIPPNSNMAYQRWLELSEQEEDDWAMGFFQNAF